MFGLSFWFCSNQATEVNRWYGLTIWVERRQHTVPAFMVDSHRKIHITERVCFYNHFTPDNKKFFMWRWPQCANGPRLAKTSGPKSSNQEGWISVAFTFWLTKGLIFCWSLRRQFTSQSQVAPAWILIIDILELHHRSCRIIWLHGTSCVSVCVAPCSSFFYFCVFICSIAYCQWTSYKVTRQWLTVVTCILCQPGNPRLRWVELHHGIWCWVF